MQYKGSLGNWKRIALPKEVEDSNQIYVHYNSFSIVLLSKPSCSFYEYSLMTREWKTFATIPILKYVPISEIRICNHILFVIMKKMKQTNRNIIEQGLKLNTNRFRIITIDHPPVSECFFEVALSLIGIPCIVHPRDVDPFGFKIDSKEDQSVVVWNKFNFYGDVPVISNTASVCHVHEEEIYIHGGYKKEGQTYFWSNDLWILFAKTGFWRHIETKNIPHPTKSLTIIGKNIVIVDDKNLMYVQNSERNWINYGYEGEFPKMAMNFVQSTLLSKGSNSIIFCLGTGKLVLYEFEISPLISTNFYNTLKKQNYFDLEFTLQM